MNNENSMKDFVWTATKPPPCGLRLRAQNGEVEAVKWSIISNSQGGYVTGWGVIANLGAAPEFLDPDTTYWAEARFEMPTKVEDTREPVVGEWIGEDHFINGVRAGGFYDCSAGWSPYFEAYLVGGPASTSTNSKLDIKRWVEQNANYIYERENPDKVVGKQ